MNDMWDEDNCGIFLLQGDELEYEELEDIKQQFRYCKDDVLDNSYSE